MNKEATRLNKCSHCKNYGSDHITVYYGSLAFVSVKVEGIN